MYNGLLLLLAACSTPAPVASPTSPPPGGVLTRSWTLTEAFHSDLVAATLPTTPQRVLLRHRDPIVGGGLQLLERVGDTLVTSPAPLTVEGEAHIHLRDATGDGTPELILRTTSGIRVVDPLTWRVLVDLPGASDDSEARAGAWPIQLDRDPELELLVPHDAGVALLDNNGRVRRFFPHSSLPEVVQLDADPAWELLYTYPLVVIDGATLRPEPIQLPLRGSVVVAPDADGDGAQELLHVGRGDGLLLNLARGTATPVRSGDLGIDHNLLVEDAHADGTMELWVPTIRGPAWMILDPVTGQPLDAVPSLGSASFSTSTARWDSDGDGVEELLRGGYGWLGVLDRRDLTWVATQRVQPPGTLTLLDMDGDGQQELIECTPDHLLVRDPTTTALLQEIELPPEITYSATCDGGDIDGDGDSEVAVLSAGATMILDLEGGAATVLHQHPGGGPPMLLADADGDGLDDLIWRSRDLCMASRGANVSWCAGRSSVQGLEVADLDADGLPEVILGAERSSTSVLSGVTGLQIASTPTEAYAVSAFQDGGRTLFAGARDVPFGYGVELTAWELTGNTLTERLTGRMGARSGTSMRMDGTTAWIGGHQGVSTQDLATGVTRHDPFSYGDIGAAAVFLPQEVLMRVSDGWIAWPR